MSKISELSDGGSIQSGDTLIAVRSGGNVKVTYGGTTTANIDGGTIDGTVIGGTSPSAITGTTITGTSFVSSGNMTFGDNDKATFGASDDLQIYHNGSHSLISETGTGNLYIQGSSAVFLGSSTQNQVVINDGSDVKLRHNGSDKLATTSTGIDVTGTVTADGLTVDGIAEISGTSTGLRIMETDTTDLNSYLRNSSGLFLVSTLNDAKSAVTNRFQITHNTGDISFYEDTGTTAKFYWDASEEALGIGTSSPAKELHISKDGQNGVRLTSTVFGADFGLLSSVGGQNGFGIYDYNASGYRFNIDSSGNVGIGTSSPSNTLTVDSGTSAFSSSGIKIKRTGALTGSSDFILAGVSGSEALAVRVNDTERMRIDSSGNVLVGKSATTGNVAGIELRSDGLVLATRDSNQPLLVNRTTTDGSLIALRKDNGDVGSIGSLNGVAGTYFGTGNTAISAYSNALRPVDGTTGSYRDNAINIGTASNRFKDLYLSGGVYLGGTGAANKLDDYEEGTWTPIVQGATTVGTGTYSFQNGSYTKVGNLVTVNGYFRVLTHTGTGNLQVGGLPFTVESGGDEYGTISIGECANLTKSADTVVCGYVVPNSNYVNIREMSTSATTTSTTSLGMDTGFDLLFTCTYRAA